MIDAAAKRRIADAERVMVARRAFTFADAAVAEVASLIQKTEAPSKLITVGAAIDEMIERSKLPVYPTPFDALNDAIGFGGMLATGQYMVPGSTGKGKTSWCIEVATHHALTGDVLIATREMSPSYYVAKAAAGKLGVPSNKLIREAGTRAKSILAAVPHRMFWLDKPTLDDVRIEADRLAQRSGAAPLVFVDYLQKFASSRMRDMKHPDPRAAAAETSEILLSISESVRCPMVIVNSTSRASGRKAQSARTMAPHELVDVAAESGAIEFDSTATIVLSLEDEFEANERVATMTVAKARYGTECHIDARFDGAIGRWRALGRLQQTNRKLREKVVKALETPAPSKSEIHRRTKGDKQTVLREVDTMVSLGLVRLTGAGYVLAFDTITEEP